MSGRDYLHLLPSAARAQGATGRHRAAPPPTQPRTQSAHSMPKMSMTEFFALGHRGGFSHWAISSSAGPRIVSMSGFHARKLDEPVRVFQNDRQQSSDCWRKFVWFYRFFDFVPASPSSIPAWHVSCELLAEGGKLCVTFDPCRR